MYSYYEEIVVSYIKKYCIILRVWPCTLICHSACRSQRITLWSQFCEVSSLLPPCVFELLELAACAFAHWTIPPALLCDSFSNYCRSNHTHYPSLLPKPRPSVFMVSLAFYKAYCCKQGLYPCSQEAGCSLSSPATLVTLWFLWAPGDTVRQRPPCGVAEIWLRQEEQL